MNQPQHLSNPTNLPMDIDELEAPLVALIAVDPATMTDAELRIHMDKIRALRADGTKRAASVNKGSKATVNRDKLSGLDDLLF